MPLDEGWQVEVEEPQREGETGSDRLEWRHCDHVKRGFGSTQAPWNCPTMLIRAIAVSAIDSCAFGAIVYNDGTRSFRAIIEFAVQGQRTLFGDGFDDR